MSEIERLKIELHQISVSAKQAAGGLAGFRNKFSERIWLVEQGYSGHAELIPGMTAEQLKAAWVDHSES